ncbi:MAG: hypothetical protein A4E37_01634 [Methanoregulaceae archaeon PtaB.Bin056]|nr:MAG: hypothetical protein A4E37_01634 [Methanoregulaceae archaeon PtaB.Bin056]
MFLICEARAAIDDGSFGLIPSRLFHWEEYPKELLTGPGFGKLKELPVDPGFVGVTNAPSAGATKRVAASSMAKIPTTFVFISTIVEFCHSNTFRSCPFAHSQPGRQNCILGSHQRKCMTGRPFGAGVARLPGMGSFATISCMRKGAGEERELSPTVVIGQRAKCYLAGRDPRHHMCEKIVEGLFTSRPLRRVHVPRSKVP